MAHDHHGAHASADDEYLETPPGAGYEHTDAHVWVLVKFAIWLTVSALAVHAGLGVVFKIFVDTRQVQQGEAEYPLATVASEPRLPAEPRLQVAPANDIYEFRTREDAVLHNYGWVDRNAGVVRIPVEEAMRLTVERGLPARAGAAAPAPMLMPADSSSGRTEERRRQ